MALILGQSQFKSMLHFHDELIEAIKRRDAKAAVREVENNLKETDVRARLLFQTANGTQSAGKR
ncbi:MAG: hypothetical protein ACTHN2_18625 [Nitrobacter sp.]